MKSQVRRKEEDPVRGGSAARSAQLVNDLRNGKSPSSQSR